jgi:hypothetical protein
LVLALIQNEKINHIRSIVDVVHLDIHKLRNQQEKPQRVKGAYAAE